MKCKTARILLAPVTGQMDGGSQRKLILIYLVQALILR